MWVFIWGLARFIPGVGGNWGPRFELFETGVSILLLFSTVNNESGGL